MSGLFNRPSAVQAIASARWQLSPRRLQPTAVFQSTQARPAASLPLPPRFKSSSPALAGLCLVAVAAAGLSFGVTGRPVSLEAANRKQVIGPDVLAEHSSPEDCWIVIDGVVYDVTGFAESHPGGAEVIRDRAGQDISSIFRMLHAKETLENVKSQIKLVGGFLPSPGLPQPATEEDLVERRRAALFPPNYVLNLAEFEPLAEKVLGKDSTAWSFLYSWADDGASFQDARRSFAYLRFLPRVNHPVKEIDSTTTYVSNNRPVPIPIFFAPTGGSALAHPEGEFNLTRAASTLHVPQCISTAASKGIMECIEERDRIVANGGARAPIWHQVYIRSDRAESERILRQAAEAGVEAIVLTVDVPVLGNREAHAKQARKLAVDSGKRMEPPKFTGVASALTGHLLFDPNMSWDDIAWARKHAPGVPLLVKGLNTVADVALAKQHGADGVIISNHGARQLDHTAPPLATLVRVRLEAPHLLEDPKFEVFIDGGVTRGTDILKALCLGAKGVGIGRSMLYAQACYGEEGVIRACEILATEIHRGMRLLGVSSLTQLKPEMVEVMDGLVGQQM